MARRYFAYAVADGAEFLIVRTIREAKRKTRENMGSRCSVWMARVSFANKDLRGSWQEEKRFWFDGRKWH